MVGDVPGRNVCESTDGKRIAAGDAATRPRLGREILKERRCRRADGPELFDVGSPGPRIGVRRSYRDVLIEAGQRTVEPARKPERAKYEHAFTIAQMAHDLPDAPLLGGIPIQRLFVRDFVETSECLSRLRFEDVTDIARLDLIDVREIVLRGLGSIGSGRHGHSSSPLSGVCSRCLSPA